jgi:hypothetical protein
MCFGSTNPKVASGADNYDQSHKALSYNPSDEIYPNRLVQSNTERENDFWANTRLDKDKEFQESRPAAAAPAPVKKRKAFTVAQYSTL